jgi:hypothetical protein
VDFSAPFPAITKNSKAVNDLKRLQVRIVDKKIEIVRGTGSEKEKVQISG